MSTIDLRPSLGICGLKYLGQSSDAIRLQRNDIVS
jgi:hypothetical protein